MQYCAWQLAKKAWEGLKFVKTLINCELFKYDKAIIPLLPT